MDLLDRKKQIIYAKEQFLHLNRTNFSGIRDEIIESWIRSKENGIDIKLQPECSEEDQKALSDSINKHGKFIDIARPYMAELYNIIEDSGFIILLTDANGYLIDSFKNIDKFKTNYTDYKLVNFSEERIGTNAIGTCLYLDRPFESWADEFWCEALTWFSTSAAPIHDRNGSLIGCIAITGFAEVFTLHTLGMATSIAFAIENQINLSTTSYADSILEDYTSFINTSISDGIILLDNEGHIKSTNKIAENILGIEEKLLSGENINEILKAPFDFKKVMKDHLDFYNTETTLYIKDKPIRSKVSITNLQNSGESIGLIIVFNKFQNNNEMPEKSKKTRTKLFTFNDIIGESLAIQNMKEISEIAAKSTSNVLILGESGTGKELVAQSIHSSSQRRNKPFVSINCGALPVNLAESELFGYEGGAYTGSKKEGQIGKFEFANGGTIFLDEIGEMPLSLQAILLRVIQDRQVVRIGGTESRDIDVRIIAATNKNLFEAVSNNTFRMDLFYRLNVFTINMPPLRERKDDIFSLTNYFIVKYNNIFGTSIKGLTDDAKECIFNYDWFGNVRELENTIERAVQIAQDCLIDINDLPTYIKNNPRNNLKSSNLEMNSIMTNEYNMLIETIRKHKGNLKASAEELKISRNTIYRKFDKYGIDYKKYR